MSVVEDVSCQTMPIVENVRRCSLIDNIRNPKQLSGITGIISFSGFETLCLAVDDYMLKQTHEKDGFLLDTRSRVLLTLMKLKTGCTFIFLSVLFNISDRTCSKYFQHTIRILSVLLKPFIYWPSKSSIVDNFPICFMDFPDTRVIIDCTEIPVGSISCVRCRTQPYSHYKQRHTVKLLIGISPAGTVIFISPVYGGKASDKFIFVQSNILKLCEKHDAIMADKGFLIEDECTSEGIKLIRPPFREVGVHQLSAADCEKNKRIASSRVHVERCIARFKNFRILKEELEWNMVKYVDDIVTIIGSLVNLSPTILGDDAYN